MCMRKNESDKKRRLSSSQEMSVFHVEVSVTSPIFDSPDSKGLQLAKGRN